MRRGQDDVDDIHSATKQPESTKGSKVPSERVVLLVITALLAVAVIMICRLSLAIMQSERSFQKLRDEHKSLRRNFTERKCEVKTCVSAQATCPANDTCLKCDVGWERYGGSCYYFSEDKSSWDYSRYKCKQQGADLVKIESREEQVFLDVRLRDKMETAEDKFWIGLTDVEEEGTWLWTDGSPLNKNLTFWSGTEPDNWTNDGKLPAGEDCVRMGETGGAKENKSWFDSSCIIPFKYICEKPAENGKLTCL